MSKKNQKGNHKILLNERKGRTKYQNLQDAAKTLRRDLQLISVYIKKEERSQINNLNFHYKTLQTSRKKEIIKNWAQISEIEHRKTIEKNQ